MRRPGAQKYFYLYQITNLVNGKIYIGIHATYNLNDGYMGSGKRIRAAITKYGLDNFKKIILAYYPTLAAALSAEKEIVTEDFCARADTYNIAVGGKCGGSLMAGKTSEELTLWRQHISDVRKVQAQDPEYRENYKKIRNSPEFLRKYAETRSKNEKAMTSAQRAARSALFKKAHADPKVRDRHSIAARKWWAGLPPEERQSRRRVWYTDGTSNFWSRKTMCPLKGGYAGVLRSRTRGMCTLWMDCLFIQRKK